MGIGNSKHDGLEEFIKVRPDGSIVKYKTSIFGWGKLQHPVKAQPEPKFKKKKKKWVDPTENMQIPPDPAASTQPPAVPKAQPNGRGPSVLPPQGQAHLQVRFASQIPTSKSTENIPIARLKVEDAAGTRLDRILKRKSVPNNSTPTPPTQIGKETGSGSTRKWNLKSLRTDPIPKGTSIVPPSEGIPPNTSDSGKGSASYYGQYRCGKCMRYWRSGLARDGVPQKCSRCGTLTFPRR